VRRVEINVRLAFRKARDLPDLAAVA